MSKEPHAKASGGGGGLSKEDTTQEHPLQAIVLCDAWGDEKRWGPLVRKESDEDGFDHDAQNAQGGGTDGEEKRPWCLLPLLNIPLLAWTLESLSSSSVVEAYLFIRSGSTEVREWLETTTFSHPSSSLRVTIRPTKACTPGDVLREVDALQILAPADFLVVQAGYVGNVDLRSKVEQFKERRVKSADKLCMSCVVTPRITATTSKFAVHVFSEDDQLYHYEESELFPKLKEVKVPREALGLKDVKVRADLESVGVAICSIEVPALFTENFDYQFYYPDFVNGILTSDLLDKTICCTIIDEAPTKPEGKRGSVEWAGVVGNTKSYDAVSKAILSRRAYPLAPDENLPDEAERYEQRPGRVYLSKELNLSRTTQINSTSLLGRSVSISSNTTVTHSVISPDVTIGSNCVIEGSYIFDKVIIGDGCTVRDSIIGEGAVLGEGVKVEGGALVGAGTVLGKGAQVVARNVGASRWDDEHGDQGDEIALLGEGHKAFFWPDSDLPEQDEDEDEEDVLDARNYSLTRLGAQLSTLDLSSSSSSLSSLSRSSSTTSLSTTASLSASTTRDRDPPNILGLSSLAPLSSSTNSATDFISECTQSLDRSFSEGHTVDNAVIELKTLRMASNVPLGQVRDLVVAYIIARCVEKGKGVKDVEGIVRRWGGLIESLTEEEAMKDVILRTQVVLAEGGTADVPFFLKLMKSFYEMDIISEDVVLEWYKSRESRTVAGEEGKKLWAGAKPFVEWLMTEDESDEEEDEEEED